MAIRTSLLLHLSSPLFWLKSDKLFKKHGLKRLGGWVVPTEHTTVGVFEAPLLKAFQSFMEPVCLAFSAYETMEVKLALSMEEVAQMLQQFAK